MNPQPSLIFPGAPLNLAEPFVVSPNLIKENLPTLPQGIPSTSRPVLYRVTCLVSVSLETYVFQMDPAKEGLSLEVSQNGCVSSNPCSCTY